MYKVEFDEIIKTASQFSSDVTIFLDIITNSHNVFITVPAGSIRLGEPFINLFSIELQGNDLHNYFSEVGKGTVIIPYSRVKMVIVEEMG